MGTHAALAERIGTTRDENAVVGPTVVLGKENIVLANTGQWVVVASDQLQVVVTENAVFVGDRNTDMKALVEYVAEQAPDIV
jgi:mannose-1-phosphate guanylyltransferase